MEYIYTALILNELDEEITEDTVTAVLEAAGADVEDSRVKALVAALEDVDIDEAVETAAVAPAAAPAAGAGGAAEAAAPEAEADEAADAEEADDDEDDEPSGEGLGTLFG
ncbi:MAG: 50S ribosomal protein P1 [Haloquadratum sp.]|jgi:large subunit ribosomal protein L12|nr:50S ribosomal protein P1 [Haloferacaceae archaeon]MDR9445316.1 50S ribosomal protein P1 [Haloquadratum sp.]